jgi:hypothetical protein
MQHLKQKNLHHVQRKKHYSANPSKFNYYQPIPAALSCGGIDRISSHAFYNNMRTGTLPLGRQADT